MGCSFSNAAGAQQTEVTPRRKTPRAGGRGVKFTDDMPEMDSDEDVKSALAARVPTGYPVKGKKKGVQITDELPHYEKDSDDALEIAERVPTGYPQKKKKKKKGVQIASDEDLPHNDAIDADGQLNLVKRVPTGYPIKAGKNQTAEDDEEVTDAPLDADAENTT